jgi:hypothetical protein
MGDTLEFMKNLWGGMGMPGMMPSATNTAGTSMPGMVMPTLSVEEINKKIADLKAVESWLTLNMNMLRGTIQALEVQSATLQTLQSMGETFNAAVASGAKGKSPATKVPESSSADGKSAAAPSDPTGKDHTDMAAFTAPLVNAAAWWDMLQGQFNQAVTHAMTEAQANGASSDSKSSADSKSAAGDKDPADQPQAAPASKRKSPKS